MSTFKSKRLKTFYGSAGMTPVVAMLVSAQPSYAGVLTNDPTISLCSGFRLPTSEVTNLIKPVAQAITPAQGLLNGIVTSALPNLSTNLVPTLNQAAAGDPITIQLVSDKGVIGPVDTCYAQANGVTLTNQAGIAIGGNAISGLGDNSKTAAVATELSAIALGDGARTLTNASNAIAVGAGATVSAAGSIALGTNATASAANSLALGTGSTAERGAQASYTTPLTTGAQASVGEVSVGTGGARRQITNVAAGSADSDAATVGQVNTVSNAVATLDGLTVKYTGGDRANIALGGGAGGTGITNLRAGAVTAASTDAVNGAQLYAVDNRVTNLTNTVSTGLNILRYADAAGVPNAANTVSTDVALTGAGGAAVRIHNVADGRVEADSTDAVNGGQLFEAVNTGVTVGLSGAVNYDAADKARVTLGGTGGSVLANVRAGDLSVASNEAVNGAQLFATNANVSLLERGGNGLLQFSNAAGTPNGGTPAQDMALVGAAAGPVTLHNVAAGSLAADSTDAVNGGQVAALDTRLTTSIDANTTNLSTFQTLVGNGGVGPVRYSTGGVAPDASAPTQSVTLVGGSTGAVQLHNVADGQIAANSTDAVNGGQIFALASSLGSGGGSALAVSYDDAARAAVTLGGASAAAVSLRNVAAGTLAAGSTDAVNGDQLFAVDTRVTALSNSAGLNILRYADAAGVPNVGNTVSNDVALTGAGGAPVRIHNVANGRLEAGSTDAVNGGQLYDAVTLGVSVGLSNAVNYDGPDKAQVTLGGTGGSVLTNVRAGNLTATSSDAVNGGQLFATNANVNLLASGGSGLLQFSNAAGTPNGGTPTQDMALVGAAAGTPVRLHNVAAGSVAAGSTDAVNGGQLFDAVAQGVSDLAVVYDDAARSRVALGGTGAPAVLLTNLQDGTLSQTSRDAVTGAQLFATNQAVDGIDVRLTQSEGDLTTLGSDFGTFSAQVANGGIGPVQYADSAAPTTPNGGIPTNDLTLVGAGAGPVALHNVAAGVLGAGSTDAVNGAQLAGLGSAFATALGGFSYDPVTNRVAGSFNYAGTSYGDVQSVFGAISAQLNSGPGADSAKYFNANSTLADSSASGENSTAIGPQAESMGDNSVAMGNNASAQSDHSVAIGTGATATDGMAVSIGMGNTASGDGAVAIGDPSTAIGDGAVVLGKDDTANGLGAIAIGNTSSATGDGSAAIGNLNSASGEGAVALGTSNVANGLGAIAIGSQNNVSGDGSLAIGSGITTTATDTMAFGSDTSATAQSAVALGNRASASGVSSVAVGTDSAASGPQSAAFGQAAVASGVLTTAIGQMATASGPASFAAGSQAIAEGGGSLALGAGAVARTDNSVALGTGVGAFRGGVGSYSAFGVGAGQASIGEIALAQNIVYTDILTGLPTPTGIRQITGLAAGSADTDAVNVAQLKGVSATLGTALAASLGGGASYDVATGAVSGPSYTLGGVTYASVGDALTALARSGTGTGTDTGTSGGTTPPPTAENPQAVTYGDTGQSTLVLGAGGTTVSNVADGTVAPGSTEAVNGGQLAAVRTQVGNLATAVENGATGAVRYSTTAAPTTPTGGARTNDVTLVGANTAAPVAIHNVADGQVAAGSTDAVNGGQLAATNARVATVETTANAAMTMGQNSVQYDAGGRTAVTAARRSRSTMSRTAPPPATR